jgi:DNA polymerase-3 subunit epsilon
MYNKRPKSRPDCTPQEIRVNGNPYRLGDQNLLLVDRGRNSGERSAIWLQGTQVRGMGYYSLNHQINNIHILETLLTPLDHYEGALEVVSAYTEEKNILKAIEL